MTPDLSETLVVEPDATAAAPTPSHPTTPPVAAARRPDGAHRDGAHRASLFDRLAPVGGTRHRRAASALAAARTRTASLGGRVVSRERAIPLTVAGLVLAASIVSVVPAAGIPGSTDDRVDAPRIVVGGGLLGAEGEVFDSAAAAFASDPTELAILAAELDGTAPSPDGSYLDDGTLLKPVAVDTTVPDVADRLREYRVKSGDTLTGIANKFGLSMMTIWWANKLSAKDDLHIGQRLIIPPVDGVIVVVQAGETLDSIAARTKGDKARIMEYNGLVDETVVIGQTLMIPEALGAAIATPTPAPRAAVSRSSGGSSGGTSSTVRPPSTYSGGRLYFPVPGHRITQYYHYGHYAIDIDGSTGDRIYSAAKGTVLYAGWKNNGGGYVVWIAHGSGLYTTYNHLSAVLVHRGQAVARGQVVGKMGATGWASGSHLHFEVWKGGAPLWPDRRVNPMKYF